MGWIWTPYSKMKPPLGTPLDARHPLADGLIGCWLMNESRGTKVVHASGQGHAGTFIGDAAWSAEQIAFTKAGQGVISWGDNPSWAQSPYQSLGVWITFTDLTQYGSIMGFDDPGSRRGLSLQLRSSSFPSSVAAAAVTTAGTNQRAVLEGALDANTEYMLVATYDGSAVKLYINSQLKATWASAGVLTYDGSNSKWCIGGDASRLRYHSGSTRYAIAYNRALTPSEIASLYVDPYQMFRRQAIELWTVEAGGASQNATATPSAVALTLSVKAPTVTATQNATVQPSAVALTLTVQEPVVSAIQNISVSPSVVALTLSVHDPVVSTNQYAIVQPDALTLVLTVHAPVLSATQNATVQPDALALTLAVQDPVVSTNQYAIVQPDALALTLTVKSPQFAPAMDATVEPLALAMNLELLYINVITTSHPTVEPDAVALTLSVQDPVVQKTGTATVLPDALALTLTVNAPVVLAGGMDAVIEPAALSLTVAVQDPVFGVAVCPDALTLALSIHDPIVAIVALLDELALTLSVQAPTVSTAIGPLPLVLTLNDATVTATVMRGAKCHYVDCDIQPDTATEQTDDRLQVRNLAYPASYSHLEGQTIHVLHNMAYAGTDTIASGDTALAGSGVNHVGLGYTSTLMPTKLDIEGLGIATTKKIVQAIVSFYQTLGGWYGDTPDDMTEIAFRDRDDAFGWPSSLFSDTKELPFDTDYEREGDFTITQTDPLPMTVRGIILPIGVYEDDSFL